jgi:tRNA dimethylallyltransferase
MCELKNKTLIVVLGPTGVGKTEISLKLAETFSCPILSSDSRQFYRELKIGTAAPTAQELSRVPHHFIGTLSLFDQYNAGQFEIDVMTLLDKLFKTHDTVMLVGGSMMYIDAVCNGIDDIPTVDDQTREHWTNVYAEKGLEHIQNELKRLDPEHYNELDPRNHKRILHALEICSIIGKPFSSIRTGTKKTRPFNILKIGLNRPRPELYERINLRVHHMMSEGLLNEAKPFFEHRQLNTLNTVGYKELYEYMAGNWTLEFAINMIQQNSRRYAKKQLSWFNRDTDINWFHPDKETEIIQFCKQNCISQQD